MAPQGNSSYLLLLTCVTIIELVEGKEMGKIHCMGSDLSGSGAWVLLKGQDVVS